MRTEDKRMVNLVKDQFGRRVRGLAFTAVLLCVNAAGAEWQVAANGTPGGDGSASRPWDLATALKPHPLIKPMDTVWVRGGLYSGSFVGNLKGGANAPVILRAYPGERAVLDGAGFSPKAVLTIQGADAWYWGLEVMNSDPRRTVGVPGSNTPETRGTGVEIFGPRVKVINCVVHDAGSGSGFWTPAVDSEMYGNVFFNGGWRAPDRTHGHAIYTQNNTGWKHIRDNILLNPYSYGLHLYGSSQSQLNNYRLEGNVNFNGAWLVGGVAPLNNIEMITNFLYKSSANLAYVNKSNKNLVFRGNYLPVTTNALYWDKVEVRENTFFVPGTTVTPVQIKTSDGADIRNSMIEDNTYIVRELVQPVVGIGDTGPATKWYPFAAWRSTFGFDKNGTLLVYPQSIPPQPRVFVRRNHYEPTRGHVVIYNWPKLDEVEVDIGAMNPQVGDKWELRNVQNYFEKKVEGVYEGKPLKVRMTGWTVASPIGEDKPLNPSTFPEFGVFVLTLQRAKQVQTVNGANPSSSLAAPGAIVTTRLEGLTGEAAAPPGPDYGPELGGVMVQLRDSAHREWMAPVLALGPGGVTYAVPPEFAIGPVAVTVYRGAESLDGGELFLQTAAPALFSADGSGTGSAAGYVTYGGTDVRDLTSCSRWPCEPVPVGLSEATADPVLTLSATAFRARPESAKVSATIANTQAEVLGVEPDSSYPGLDLVRLRVPTSLAGRGTVSVKVSVDQLTSNAVTVALQ